MQNGTKNYAPHPRCNCPRCGSPDPHCHPAVQLEGEVQLCTDPYHLIPTNQNRPEYIAAVEKARG